jgi:hypothetical protein
MKTKVIRMMLCVGLLMLLLGKGSPRLMAQGGGMPPTDSELRSTRAHSLDLIAGGPGIPPTGGPRDTTTVSVVS